MNLARTTTGHLVAAAPGQRAVCPYCEGAMLAKCGSILEWHWAHIDQTCQEWEMEALRMKAGVTGSKEFLPPAGTCYTCERWERGCTFVADYDVDEWRERWTRPTKSGLARVHPHAPPCPMHHAVRRRTPYGEVPKAQRLEGGLFNNRWSTSRDPAR